MKKFLCIFLSALLICALFIIPASAAEAPLNGVFKVGPNGSLVTSLSTVLSYDSVTLPYTTEDTIRFYAVYDLPSFESLSSVTVRTDFDSAVRGLYYNVTGSDSLGTVSGTYDSSTGTFTVDLSSLPSDVEHLVFNYAVIGSGVNINTFSVVLDYQSPSVWNGISEFIGGLFGAVGSILGGALNNSLLLMFLILIPLSGIVCNILYYDFLNKRKKSNSINRYRSKRGN